MRRPRLEPRRFAYSTWTFQSQRIRYQEHRGNYHDVTDLEFFVLEMDSLGEERGRKYWDSVQAEKIARPHSVPLRIESR